MERTLLRFAMIGSVDDGKSTLIGRLLHDLRVVYEDELASVRRVSTQGIDLAFITDGLRAEREQGITIDVAYRHFSTLLRRFIIADTPGHEQYTRNMASGASTADVAVILVDATRGILPQTLRHAYLSWLLGIRHLCVAVNKMDLVDFGMGRFQSIRAEFEGFARRLPGCRLTFIPQSALNGDNVVERSDRMPWYQGPTLLLYLETVDPAPADGPTQLRFPIQYVIRGANGAREYAGQLAGGALASGDELLALPSKRTVRIESVRRPDGLSEPAPSPMCVSVCLDRQIDLCRGDMLVDSSAPPLVARSLTAVLFWMSDVLLAEGRPYLLKHTTQKVCAEVTRHLSTLDVETLTYGEPRPLARNGIGRVLIETQRPVFCDPYTQNRSTGSFILIDPLSNQTLAAGLVETAVESPPEPRGLPRSHGATVWLTGLCSSGKTTLAQRVCEELHATGHKVELLDGDIVRKQLSKDLGFSKQDRDENIRRIGFVAELLSKNGVVAVVAAISPYRAIRDEIRRRIGNFIEVYVNAPLEVCEMRDLKGLYRKARAGELKEFTGIDDPYEPPLNPEVECRTDLETVEECTRRILEFLRARLAACGGLVTRPPGGLH
jgi:bifunctional enzyme CysN/CysC